MKAVRRIATVLFLVSVAVVVAGLGTFGEREGRGEVSPIARTEAVLAATQAARATAGQALDADPAKQILFGDLHVHTTFSADAFTFSLPMTGGEGGHPPADACDFARHCAALDFYSINDHAGNLSSRHWQETIASIRQCNAVAGDSGDMVAFLGWEWTQAGQTPDTHYGHKNVVLRHTDDARIPVRPIAATKEEGQDVGQLGLLARGAAALVMGGRIHDWAAYLTELDEIRDCPPATAVRDLPGDCREAVATPAELFEKLDDWGHESIVIPHGTSWGIYTPPGSSWNKQLEGAMHDPDRQTLLEVYSGHGDSEVYRDWRAVEFDPAGRPRCPAPRANYTAACWRAGEIIAERCRAEGETEAECAARAALARKRHLAGGQAGHLVVPGAVAEDWLDSGQCQDCRQPAFNYRPASSAQYILALGNFDEDPAAPRRFHMGLMASSDNHFGRAGSGYKEVARRGMTESLLASRDGSDLGLAESLILPPPRDKVAHSLPFEEAVDGVIGFQRFESERSTSFLITGGLIATHADGRGRDAIWESLQRREVYGTTGPRILLWFDLVNGPGGRLPMGSELSMSEAPLFEVRATGSFVQKPGCPEGPITALGADDIERLCKGECYHPGDQRRAITRIEIVRIRPQIERGEEIGGLIDDPWRSFSCNVDATGCTARFRDEDFVRGARETVYYARVFEEKAPGINAQNLRCERDASGECLSVQICPGTGGSKDDCLAEHEPRAWSSPIRLRQPPS
jgi:hypothetical protein